MVTEYHGDELLPLLSSFSSYGGEYVGVGRSGYDDDTTLQRGIAMSCLRMSSVNSCDMESDRVSMCSHGVVAAAQ